ncbi:hypothetical protein LINGRAHAP2_LOCUS36975 [Linum grandiflorum]
MLRRGGDSVLLVELAAMRFGGRQLSLVSCQTVSACVLRDEKDDFDSDCLGRKAIRVEDRGTILVIWE